MTVPIQIICPCGEWKLFGTKLRSPEPHQPKPAAAPWALTEVPAAAPLTHWGQAAARALPWAGAETALGRSRDGPGRRFLDRVPPGHGVPPWLLIPTRRVMALLLGGSQQAAPSVLSTEDEQQQQITQRMTFFFFFFPSKPRTQKDWQQSLTQRPLRLGHR